MPFWVVLCVPQWYSFGVMPAFPSDPLLAEFILAVGGYLKCPE